MTLYRVKFAYCITIDAEGPAAAHKAACKQLKEFPSSAISAVEEARYAAHRPLWKRLLTGR